MTLEQRIYAWLRHECDRPVTMYEIAAELELPKDSAGEAMRRLRRKGCVEMLGPQSQAKWRATNVRPTDLRGLTPGSHAVRVKLADERRQGPQPKRRTIHGGVSLQALWRLPQQQQGD